MIIYLLLINVISLLWQANLCASQCTRTISDGVITFSCSSSISSQELNLYDLSVEELDSITSIVAGGEAGTIGPFTSIPPNICLLKNLESIDLSSNQIVQVDPTGSFSECLSNIMSLDLHSNYISQFPSYLIYNMPNLEDLNFRNNNLTAVPANAFANVSLLNTIDFSYNQLTTFELWALEVNTSADFSHNNIATITNNYFFDTFTDTMNTPIIYLTNNAAQINFTDAVYEMYNQCEEVIIWLNSTSNPTNPPYFTLKMTSIDFGTTQINCGCNQYYFLEILKTNYGSMDSIPSDFPIRTATCIHDLQNTQDSVFINSSCIDSNFDMNSTVNFSQVYPRLCEIYHYEGGQLTTFVNISAPISNAPTYPHYEAAFMNPGACFFTFINTTTMNIKCTNETSNTSSTIPSELLNSSYMANIQYVTYPTLISSLPSYLCSLPSKIINLSYQAFTTLTDATFPCLDSFTTVILSHNDLTSVNMASGNFQNLVSLDLSSNMLTTLPYSILTPTPSSLRYLDLRNNSLTSIDLFVYTLKNITVYLDNNPINSSSIINPQHATLQGNGTASVNVTYSSSVTNGNVIIQDSTVASLFPCGVSFSLIQSTLNIIRLNLNATLKCTCASFGLRQLYQANGFSITKIFTCSNATDAQTYPSLTNVTCSNATIFQIGPCPLTTQSPPVQSSATGASKSNTGLIVGLVVGLVGGFLLICLLVLLCLYLKSKSTAAAAKKPVSRAAVVGQTPEDSLSTRVQPRNLRAVRLAPIPTASTSALPDVPVKVVTPTANTSLLSYPNNTLRTSAKGIPVRLDSIRSPSEIIPQYPPNSNALTNSSSFRPINNLSSHQVQLPPQQLQTPKPRLTPLLNTGGDIRH